MSETGDRNPIEWQPVIAFPVILTKMEEPRTDSCFVLNGPHQCAWCTSNTCALLDLLSLGFTSCYSFILDQLQHGHLAISYDTTVQ